jgi:hypothetical protein
MSRSEPAGRRQWRRSRQPDTVSSRLDGSMPATGLESGSSLNPRRSTAALLMSAVVAIAACGGNRDDGSTRGQATRAADPVSAWQVYYDLTHPDFDRVGEPAGSDPVSAWQVYYDLTHPDFDRVGEPAGSDPVSAWQVYYDLTHPDFDRVGEPAGSDPVSAWQVYYDLTHPDFDRVGEPAGSDAVSAWQEYYELTHPDAAPAGLSRPPVTPVATLLVAGLASGSGSTVGPGRDLYVTEGATGRVLRVDPTSGDVNTFARRPASARRGDLVDDWIEKRSPKVTPHASFDGRGSGSTIGPDGALYVTDGNAGHVLRIDRRTGEVTPYATGLPPRLVRNGGPMDVAFVGARAYVLVTLVGSDVGGDDTVGIYRIERDGNHTVFADIGAWSVANPPDTSFFVPTGVQYAMQRYRHGFLVTDGHHNRVLHVDRHGAISEFATFGNDVPTGLDSVGGRVVVAQAGPVPHLPTTGKVVAVHPRSGEIVELASGARLLVDVERGPRGTLYALSQGEWDGVAEGSPAKPDTGRLVVVGRDGSLTPVVDSTGAELVLDRPTSMEFVGRSAYVVSIIGDVVRIDNL